MTQVISTVLVTASSYALIGLATAKDELGIPSGDTTQDAWLTRAISQVSTSVANYCNRVFPVETVRDVIYPDRGAWEWQGPGNILTLQLSRWPLLSPPVTLPTSADAPSGNVLTFADASDVVAGQPVSNAALTDATVVVSVDGGAVTLSAPIGAEIAAGSAVTFGLAVELLDPIGDTAALIAGEDFAINAVVGQLTRLGAEGTYARRWRPVPTVVTYQAGYAAIPDDIVDAALRVITGRFQAKGRDPLLKAQEQPGLGRREFWIGTPPNVRGGFTEEIADLLDNYRVEVIA